MIKFLHLKINAKKILKNYGKLSCISLWLRALGKILLNTINYQYY